VLYRRQVGRVTAFAARRCADPQEVSDLVAATFVAVIESAQTYDPSRGPVVPWILGIEGNLWAERGRRVYREREVLTRTLGQRVLDDDEYVRLEEQIDAARVTGAVGHALARLEPEQREALLLAGYEGLTSRKAATALGISPTAFRMRLSRARRALRRALERNAEPGAVAATPTESGGR
jgi:RNA polymerase sigma factor (sigma-70 family)